MKALASAKKVISSYFSDRMRTVFHGLYFAIALFYIDSLRPTLDSDIRAWVTISVLIIIIFFFPIIAFSVVRYQEEVKLDGCVVQHKIGASPIPDAILIGTKPLFLYMELTNGRKVREYEIHFEKPPEIRISFSERPKWVNRGSGSKYSVVVKIEHSTLTSFYLKIRHFSTVNVSTKFDFKILIAVNSRKTKLRETIPFIVIPLI